MNTSSGVSPEQMLREFHGSKAIHGGLMPGTPTPDIPEWVQKLRLALLDEEVQELHDAVEAGDIVKIADGIADIAYVVIGTAVAYGVPFDAVLAEVHRSNMTKINTPAEAKLVKGPDYEPPRIAELLCVAGHATLDCGCEVRLSNVACWYHDEREYGVAYPGCDDCRFGVPPVVHRCTK